MNLEWEPGITTLFGGALKTNHVRIRDLRQGVSICPGDHLLRLNHSEFTVNSLLAHWPPRACRCITQASILLIHFIYQVHSLSGPECRPVEGRHSEQGELLIPRRTTMILNKWKKNHFQASCRKIRQFKFLSFRVPLVLCAAVLLLVGAAEFA